MYNVGCRRKSKWAYVVASAEEVFGVHGPEGPEYPLHALRVVNVAGLALVAAPDSDGPVIRTADELLACGRELNVHHGGHMALVDVLRLVKVSRIKDIAR